MRQKHYESVMEAAKEILQAEKGIAVNTLNVAEHTNLVEWQCVLTQLKQLQLDAESKLYVRA